MNKKGYLNQMQLVFFIINSEVGVGILSLPYAVGKNAHHEAPNSVIVASMMALVMITIIWALGRRFPKHNLYEYLPIIYGKWAGKTLSGIYILYQVIISAYILIVFYRMTKMWVLIHTPKFVIGLTLIFLALYLARENLRIIGRFYTLSSFLIIIPVLLVSYVFTDIDIYDFFPIGETAIHSQLLGASQAVTSFLGFEVLLILYPYVQGSSLGKLRSALTGHMIVTFVYIYVTFITVIYFSDKEVMIIPEPLLYMLKGFTFGIVERTDLIFFTIWIVLTFTSVCTYIYSASMGITQLLNVKTHKTIVPFVCLAGLIISLVPDLGTNSIGKYSTILIWSGYSLVFVLPLITLLLAVVMKKGKKAKKEPEYIRGGFL